LDIGYWILDILKKGLLAAIPEGGSGANLPHSAFCKCQSLSNKKTVQVNLNGFLFPSLALDRGERGIRTPGGVTLAGFQDQCIRPLCHFSMSVFDCSNASANIMRFFVLLKHFVFFLSNFSFR
jgi:hypothetical protein